MYLHTGTKCRGNEWGEASTKNCYQQTQPISGSTYPGGPLPAQSVVKNTLGGMSKPVYLLDITLLSQLRKDAHPSAYSGDHTGMDCSHWCLAGLPDTWNQILYAVLTTWTEGGGPRNDGYSTGQEGLQLSFLASIGSMCIHFLLDYFIIIWFLIMAIQSGK